MKYSDLISFNPIEDVIQLVTADDSNKARVCENIHNVRRDGTELEKPCARTASDG